MFTMEWFQHAVGHGGFHTGRARTNDVEFNWIFDCGAKKTAVFDTYLKTWTARNRQPIDWLFISHFDTDHVSGLDTLMSRAVVRDVMVPYVNERELVLQLLHEISRGNVERTLFELAADPAAYFLGRGADRVTFYRGRPLDGSKEDVAGPVPDRPEGKQGWTMKFHPQPSTLPTPRRFQASRLESSRVFLMSNETDMTAAHGGACLRLKPHRAPLTPYAHRGLVKALQGLVGPVPWLMHRPGLGDLAFAIASHARTALGRSALRKLYKDHVGSPNRSSLSLLTMPVLTSDGPSHWDRSQGPFPDCGEGEVAWVNTGDAELLDIKDLDAWEDAYAQLLKSVRVMALPHHGSDKNSGEEFQKLCPDALLVAHVKRSGKHPGADVTDFAGKRLACVTSDEDIAVWLHFYRP